jgi:hypothetical protein
MAVKAIGESALQFLTNALADYGSIGAEAISSPLLFAQGFGNEDAAAEFARLREQRRSKLPVYEPSEDTIQARSEFFAPAKEFATEKFNEFVTENPNFAESVGDYLSDPRVAHTLGALELGLPSSGRAVKGFMDKPTDTPTGGFNLSGSPASQKGIINLLTGEDFDVKLAQPISTRIPSETQQIKQGINPHTRGDLLVEQSLLTPEKQSTLANIYRDYPGLRNIDPFDDVAALEEATDFMANNLNFVMDIMPDKWADKSMDWYNGFNRIAQSAAKDHGTSHEQAIGIIAALSPQTDWNVNLSRADRIMDTWNTRQDFPWSEEMSSVMPKMQKSISEKRYKEKLPNIVGKRLRDLDDPAEKAMWIRAYDEAHNPREFYLYNPDGSKGVIATTKSGQPREANWAATMPIEKSVRMLMDGSQENISRQVGEGHKVRSFFRNAADPTEESTATMDTHAVAAALMRPVSAKAEEVGHNFGAGMSDTVTGMKGTYPVNQAAYQQVAQRHGVPSRAIQSPTWEFIREMTEGQKGQIAGQPKGIVMDDYVNNIWAGYEDGRISQRQAQELIIEAFGMPDEPY